MPDEVTGFGTHDHDISLGFYFSTFLTGSELLGFGAFFFLF